MYFHRRKTLSHNTTHRLETNSSLSIHLKRTYKGGPTRPPAPFTLCPGRVLGWTSGPGTGWHGEKQLPPCRARALEEMQVQDRWPKGEGHSLWGRAQAPRTTRATWWPAITSAPEDSRSVLQTSFELCVMKHRIWQPTLILKGMPWEFSKRLNNLFTCIWPICLNRKFILIGADLGC